jgi:hypothetical protein
LSRSGFFWPSSPPNRSKIRPTPWLRALRAAGNSGFQNVFSGMYTSTSG